MILPIYLYAEPVLRERSKNTALDATTQQRIEDMFETMYQADGVGLAANQIGQAVRLFVVDASLFYTEKEEISEEEYLDLQKKYKKAFVNPEIHSVSGKEMDYTEGCLSLPNLHANVRRPDTVVISYWDENFVFHEKITFTGMMARVIQHEYDHIEGKLFIDYLSAIDAAFLQKKIEMIRKRKNIKADYKIKI